MNFISKSGLRTRRALILLPSLAVESYEIFILPCVAGLALVFLVFLALQAPQARAQVVKGRPTLEITNDTSAITLLWPVDDAGYSLWWTPAVEPTSWQQFPNPPVLSADESNLLVIVDSFFQATNPQAFFRLVSSSIAAPAAPSVATGYGAYTCNLRYTMAGSITPNGLDTIWWFQWGPVGGSDSPTASDVVAGTNEGPVGVFSLITGLAPGTTYHYQLYGSNADGIASGGDSSFITAGLPGAVTSGATNVTSSSAILLGKASAEGSANGLAGHFQWGNDTGYGSNTPSFFSGSPASDFMDESYSLTGLQPNTTYHFRIVVFNCSGQSVGADAQFTTSAQVQQQPPTVVTTNTTSVGTTCATLNGTVNPNGYPNGTTYFFQYGSNTGYGITSGTGPAGTGNSAVPVNMTICGLAPGTTYHYQIVAGNPIGTSGGLDFTFTTAGGCPQPAPYVQTQPATQVTSSYANMQAIVNPNGADTHFGFQWGTDPGDGNTFCCGDAGSGNMNITEGGALPGLAPSTTYYYRAFAFNSCGTNFGANVVFTTGPVSCPQVRTLGVADLTTNSATLSGLINPEGADAHEYIQWGTTPAAYGPGVNAADVGSGNSWLTYGYAQYGLMPYTQYYYRIVGYNNFGCTNFGTNVGFYTLPFPPSVVTGAATSAGLNSATLNATVNPHGPSAWAWFEYGTTTSYGAHTSQSYVSPATTAQPVAIPLNGLQNGTQYHYRAVATNSGGTTYGNDQIFNTSPTWAVGSWAKISNFPYSNPGHMLLLSDGTVMVQNFGNVGWYGLKPDQHGHYLNGAWVPLSEMIDSRYYYTSQVLPNGKVLVAGGEYGDSASGHSAEIYDPVANLWTATPSAGVGFGDSESIMLSDGRVLVEPVGFYQGSGSNTFIYDPAANQWSPGPTDLVYQDESTWVKLPDDSILTVDIYFVGATTSERYIPYGNTSASVADAALPVSMSGGNSEVGGAFMLADGRAFWLGGSGHTAIYTPTGNTNNGHWAQGPDMPFFSGTILGWSGTNYVSANYSGLLTAQDTPAAMMNNGKILCQLSPGTDHSEVWFYECDPAAGGFLAAPCPTNSTPGTPFLPAIKITDATSMLDLPDGTVLYNDGGNLYIYTPATAPLPAGKPTINNVSWNSDGSLHLSGTLFNGISQGSSYGDDAQEDTNYPLVRFTDGGGYITYGRTYNWSSTGVQTGGKIVTTDCKVPGHNPGSYSIQVVANGNASSPVIIQLP